MNGHGGGLMTGAGHCGDGSPPELVRSLFGT